MDISVVLVFRFVQIDWLTIGIDTYSANYACKLLSYNFHLIEFIEIPKMQKYTYTHTHTHHSRPPSAESKSFRFYRCVRFGFAKWLIWSIFWCSVTRSVLPVCAFLMTSFGFFFSMEGKWCMPLFFTHFLNSDCLFNFVFRFNFKNRLNILLLKRAWKF